MDTPRIQYTTSGDGTQIAYAVLGSGPPLLILCPRFAGGLDIRLRARRSAPFYEALTARHRVTLFDWRNSGLSGPATSFAVESVVGDLESVVKAAGLERFDLWAVGNTAIAVEFAALHPGNLRKLVLSSRPQGSTGDAFGMSYTEQALSDWNAFTELYALRVVGWFETGREWLDQFRKQWTPETFVAFESAFATWDPFRRAGSVQTETLVLAPDGSADRVRLAQRLAAALPNGRLIVGGSGPETFDPDQVKVADGFLISSDAAAREIETPARQAASPVQTILFTDIEGHTAMMQRLGDAKGREVLREHERITREALAAHGGAEVKTMGDGFMASFGSAQGAVECAIALQRAIAGAEWPVAVVAPREAPEDGPGYPAPREAPLRQMPNADSRLPIAIRIGINAGEPVAEDGDLFGSSVILAARTAAKAEGGEILVTDVVRQLVAGKGFLFADRGETEMRGFEEPVRLYEVRWA